MQQFKTVYSAEYIQYRPYFVSGCFVIILSICTLLMFIILLFFPQAGLDAKALAAFLAGIPWLFFRKEMRSAFDIITISYSGARFYNSCTKKEHMVLWDDVEAVYFWANHYKFPNYFRVYVKKMGRVLNDYDKQWDYALPDLNVDGKKLQSFIPSYLRVNESIYDWDK